MPTPTLTATATATNRVDAQYLAFEQLTLHGWALPPLPNRQALQLAHRICDDAVKYTGHLVGVLDDSAIANAPGLGQGDSRVHVITALAVIAARFYCPEYEAPFSIFGS